jgi:general L-amino acid transport system substrate-binding protein
MIIGEELGITSANVDEMKSSPNPEVLRLLGVNPVEILVLVTVSG